jgi:uncharacterized MAPEG superfamily protein
VDPELRALAWAVILGLSQVLIAGSMATRQRGLKWNVSNRDAVQEPLTGAAARADRASRNFLETFAFFAAAALAVAVSHHGSANTSTGAFVYLIARLVYFPVYVVGIPYLRTLVYAVSLWGILQLVEALF